MTPSASKPSREDVLDAFAVEPNPGRGTLERYLRDFPEYAAELVDLSRELSRELCEDNEPLSAEDHTLIDMAWRRHAEATPKPAADPLATLSVAEQRELAQRLDVPRQIITAFREHRVEIDSVPHRFLALFAAAVNCSIELLLSALALPPTSSLVRSHKAEVKPRVHVRVTFEQLLIDAGVPEDKRALLVADDN